MLFLWKLFKSFTLSSKNMNSHKSESKRECWQNFISFRSRRCHGTLFFLLTGKSYFLVYGQLIVLILRQAACAARDMRTFSLSFLLLLSFVHKFLCFSTNNHLVWGRARRENSEKIAWKRTRGEPRDRREEISEHRWKLNEIAWKYLRRVP